MKTARLLTAITALTLAACGPNNFQFARNANSLENPNGTPTPTFTNQDYTVVIGSLSNNVDILIVDDNSDSMTEEQASMGSKFLNFTGNLNGYDWRVGITTTDIGRENGHLISLKQTSVPDPATLFDAATIASGNYPDLRYVLVRNTSGAAQIFSDSVQIGNTGSGDERGIYAANLALDNNDPLKFFRADSHLAVVVISDEDERSTGQNLQPNDLPASLISHVATKWNETKSFSFHAIVTRPNDPVCLGMNGKYVGNTYAQLVTLTTGILGNICAADYGSQLAQIGQTIQQQAQSISLRCAPVAGSFSAEFVPALVVPVSFNLNGNKLSFSPLPPAGSTLHLKYTCQVP